MNNKTHNKVLLRVLVALLAVTLLFGIFAAPQAEAANYKASYIELMENDLKLNISDYFDSSVAYQLPEGVKAYVSEILEGKKLKMTELASGVVPANTAVLLWNESVANEDVTVNLTIVENTTFEGTNSFVGTVAAENLKAEKDCYSLQKGTKGKVGFYEKSTGTKGGFKAWIEMAKTGEARAFTIIFDGEDATGIKEALGLENENVEIYDLSGRRLDKPAKGVNIIGGKTVIVR